MGAVFFTAPLYLLRGDAATIFAATTLSTITATNLHCGYDFPWMFHNICPWYHGSRGHYTHHRRPNRNLSIFFNFMDRLFGTHSTN